MPAESRWQRGHAGRKCLDKSIRRLTRGHSRRLLAQDLVIAFERMFPPLRVDTEPSVGRGLECCLRPRWRLDGLLA
jgi:hypothetical protein